MSQPVKVVFSNTKGWETIHPPVPASSLMPDWFKEMDNYIGGKKIPSLERSGVSTIKRCVPVFDAITSGYLILLPSDVYVHALPDRPFFQWPGAEETPVQFHASWQAEKHPNKTEFEIPKWANRWVIQTPPGYSSLFITPLHRDLPFEIFPGVVDTDNYNHPVLFPFVLKDKKWEGLIPAGTPIAQVIPFKRTSFQMSVTVNELDKNDPIKTLLKTKFFDVYRKMFWVKKEFK